MTKRIHGLSVLAAALVLGLPAALVQQEALAQGEARVVEVEPLSDEQVQDFLKQLEAALEADAKAAEEDPAARRRSEVQMLLFRGNPYITSGLANNRSVSEAQVEKLVAGYERLKEQYPSQAEALDKEIFKVSNLSIGRKAPNIKGIDLDEVEFELKEYRNKVVVIKFSGDW